MKSIIVSYSLTGNNEALAGSVAKELSVEHIKISEPKPRAMGSIILDMICNRTPQVQPKPDSLNQYDLILFFGPIWMGQAAAPLRSYLRYLKSCSHKYVFISISGGADGANPKLAGELKKRSGAEPAALIDLHIADLLPSDPKPVRKDTSAYRINDGDIKKMTNTIVEALRRLI
jgi:hypothetical protein